MFKMFEASITTIVLRFYLMMAVAIVGFFTNQYWIAAFAFPIFLSAMMAVKINRPTLPSFAFKKTALPQVGKKQRETLIPLNK